MVNENILIVEDSPLQAEMLRRILVDNGYDVSVATNGFEGLEMAQTLRPALVISDIVMPGMDGYEMTRKIKNSPETRDIPVVLLTHLIEVEDMIKGLEANAAYYFTKPYDPDYILSKIKLILENQQQFRNMPEKQCVEFNHKGRHYEIRSGRSETMSFIFSTYENSVRQNKELAKAHEEVRRLNNELESRVLERTAALEKEIEGHTVTEGKLTSMKERFRAVVETAGDAIVGLRSPDTVYLWNKKAEEMFGYRSEEIVGRYLHEMIVPPRYLEKSREGLNQFFDYGTGPLVGKTIEIEALRRDGSEFPVELTISAMNIHGEWQATGIIRDITERRKAEEKLKERLDELERFRKATIQREFRMKELKDRIQELEKGKA